MITVGLADPDDEKNVKNIRKAALRQIPKPLADRTEFYHLRGGIDYEKLSFKHRMMMKMLYEQVKKQPVGEQDADTRAMIETYGQKVSFVDLACLDNIVKKLEGYPCLIMMDVPGAGTDLIIEVLARSAEAEYDFKNFRD